MIKSKGRSMKLWSSWRIGALLWAVVFMTTTLFIMFGGNHWWYAGLMISLAALYAGWRLMSQLAPDLMTEAVAYGFWFLAINALLDYSITRHLDADFYLVWSYWAALITISLIPVLWFKFSSKKATRKK